MKENQTMEKRIYIKPETTVAAVLSDEVILGEGSFAIDNTGGEGTTTPIEDGDPEIIFSKKNNLWEEWE